MASSSSSHVTYLSELDISWNPLCSTTPNPDFLFDLLSPAPPHNPGVVALPRLLGLASLRVLRLRGCLAVCADDDDDDTRYPERSADTDDRLWVGGGRPTLAKPWLPWGDQDGDRSLAPSPSGDLLIENLARFLDTVS